VFAGFAAMAKPAAATEYSFDLSTAFAIQPPAAPPAERERSGFSIEPAEEFAPAAPTAALADERELDLDAVFDEPAGDARVEPAHGPDPAVLATLARLERFLSAIESLRA
jgi:hypothetical protein